MMINKFQSLAENRLKSLEEQMKKVIVSVVVSLLMSAFAFATTDVNIVGFTVADGTFSDDVLIAGNLGVGTTNPAYQVEIVSEASPATYIVQVSSQDLTSLFRVKGNGDVHIGPDNAAQVSTFTAGALTIPGAFTAATVTSIAGLAGTTLNATGAATLDSTLDVDGNLYWGAANYRSTGTASSGAWAITGGLTSLGALAGTTLNTGQGAYELYKMDQNVDTTATPTFVGLKTTSANVGIGTATPTALLHIKGSIADIILQRSAGGAVNIEAWPYNNGYAMNKFSFTEGAATGRGVMSFYNTNDALTLTENMRIDGAYGNVGIGTTDPIARLSVGGAIGTYSRTTAELMAITPTAVGQMYYDSTVKKIVVSTGTGAGQFASADGSTW